MRSREQILAEVVDGLIRQGDRHTPPEIAQLVEIGARLHNECPEADPAFLQRLEQRLRAEWAPPGRVRPLLAALSGWRPRLSPVSLRLAASGLVALLLLAALSARTPLLRTAEAGLGEAISLFRQVRVEQSPGDVRAPPLEVSAPHPELTQHFSSLEEARAAGQAVRAPAYLPSGLVLNSVMVVEEQGQERLVLQYTGLDASLGPGREFLVIQEFRGDVPGEATITLPGDVSRAERLEVAGRTALWFPPPKGPQGQRAQWLDGDVLLVQDGDILIEVFGTFGRDESVRIAESLFR